MKFYFKELQFALTKFKFTTQQRYMENLCCDFLFAVIKWKKYDKGEENGSRSNNKQYSKKIK